MAIPRFNAQTSPIQVPSMKNFQEEQNASIAKSLSDFGATLIGSSIKLYVYEQKQNQQMISALLAERSNLQARGGHDAEIAEIDEKIKSLGGRV